MSGISVSLSSQSSFLCSLASPFSLLLSNTHTHGETGVLPVSRLCVCVRVFPDCKPTAIPEQRCSLQLCKRSVTLLLLGIRCRSAVECKSEPAALFPAPVDLSLISVPSHPLWAEDEDLGSETTVGSLTGHQQSTHQITEHIQVGRNPFLLFCSL